MKASPDAKTTSRRALWRLFGALAVAYTGICLVAWAYQDRLVFRPTPGLSKTPADRGLAYRDVDLATADGVSLHGWYVAAPDNALAPRHILFLHGNAGNLSHRLYTLQTLHQLGHAVLMVDYRGYGLSGGSPSETGTALDARAAWAFLRDDMAVSAENIVIYGRSLGGAVAAGLAVEVHPAALILESTFTRLRDIGHHRYPWLPVKSLLSMRFDTLSRLATIDCPVLIAHSPADQVVPYWMGRRLAQAAKPPKQFIELKGSHNRAFRSSAGIYHHQLDKFMRQPEVRNGPAPLQD